MRGGEAKEGRTGFSEEGRQEGRRLRVSLEVAKAAADPVHNVVHVGGHEGLHRPPLLLDVPLLASSGHPLPSAPPSRAAREPRDTRRGGKGSKGGAGGGGGGGGGCLGPCNLQQGKEGPTEEAAVRGKAAPAGKGKAAEKLHT